MTVFSLSGDIAERLVENNGHTLVLLILSLPVNRDLLVRAHFAAEFANDLTVNFNPAFGDPLIGFSS